MLERDKKKREREWPKRDLTDKQVVGETGRQRARNIGKREVEVKVERKLLMLLQNSKDVIYCSSL